MFLTTPHRVVLARDLEPGLSITGGAIDPLVIDEVTRTIEGVRIVGYPITRVGSGRRVSLDAKAHDLIAVLPHDDEREEIAATFADALVGKGQTLKVAYDRIVVLVRGVEWVLRWGPSFQLTVPDDDGPEEDRLGDE